ncbi:unnamed protein product [Calypogeia fissa]
MEPEPGPRRDTLLSVGFNQDYGCLACGTATGFRIYNCEPFKETFRREFNSGGIGLVEMLFRSNILALVGGGSTPGYPSNKVMIWDDHQSRCIGELSFRSEVRAVRLRHDRIVVILQHKVYIYNFADLKLFHQIETVANPKGLCALSSVSSSPPVLACLGLHRGQVRIENLDSLKKTQFITAHDSDLACFALTFDGRLLATASTKGTLIRIFNTADGSRLHELRRGADRAEIYSLAFSQDAQWLALSSDKGTVHVFSLRAAPPRGTSSLHGSKSGRGSSVVVDSKHESSAKGNRSFDLSVMKGVLPKYFSSKWSFSQYRLPEETKSIVAFGPQKNSVIIVGTDGSFYKCAFDSVNGGEMLQQEHTKFMRPENETAK